MRLTRRGVAVLTGAICCYAVGELAGYAFFRVLAGVAVGCLLAAVGATFFRPKVEVSRTVYPDRIERGKPALATLVVRNTMARRQGAFAAADRVGAELHRVQVRPLPPGAEATYHYELPTSVRGKLRVGPLALTRLDPFGLVRTEQTVGGTAELWVYPRRHQARSAQVAHPQHHHAGPITDPPLRGSTDLRTVREYVPGDEVRHLYWKATARTGQLMVREYSDPARTRLVVVLDTRVTSMRPAVFEEAVEVATSLLYASAAAGQQCRLITSTGTDTPVDSGLRAARLLLDELCLVGQTGAEEATLVPPALATSRPGGAVVVVTGPEADLGSVRRWRPTAVIRLGVSQPATDSSPGAITGGSAADVMARWNAWWVGP